MALNKFGFIVTGKDMDPRMHRMEMKSTGLTMIAIGISRPEQAVAVARDLLTEGIQLIELCGGFGPIWTAKVIEAVGNKIPVGSVSYGPESIDSMHALFS